MTTDVIPSRRTNRIAIVYKTPTLRNVMLTPPYMHDGSIATIEDAIRIMHQFQIGKNISDADTKSLVAFLNTLTGEYKGELLQ